MNALKLHYHIFLTYIIFSFVAHAQKDAWQDAEWISCDRPINSPQLIPETYMGSWIVGPKTAQSYQTKITLPETPIVRAIAWWGNHENARSAPVANGHDNHFNIMTKRSNRLLDLAFLLQPGENLIELRYAENSENNPATIGIRIQFADGQEILVKSGSDWTCIDESGNEHPVKVLADYGDPQFRKIPQYSKLRRLAPAWFRTSVNIKEGLKRATLLHCGLGYGEAWINGKAVSDRVLSPPQTDYEDFCMYETDDVTALLQPGENALSVYLASGWYHQLGGFGVTFLTYGRPRMRACLQLDYADGSSEYVVSNEEWSWKEGAIIEDHVYVGSIVDYRKDHDEWAHPDTGKNWQAATRIEAPGESMQARDFPPMRRVREIKPASIHQVSSETWLVDFGENIAGWVRLAFHEEAGREINIRYSETASDGLLRNSPSSFWRCHSELQRDIIYADGKPHTFEPRFSYKGFRWAEISGLKTAPDKDTLRAIVVNTDCRTTAHFSSAHPMLDRMWAMGLRTHYANMHSILEDCPHREKCLWGGDLHASWSVGFHGMDSASFYHQQVRLYYTGPKPEGNVPGLVGVGKRISTTNHDFNWSVSPLFIAWRLWTHFGDLSAAREYHDEMLHFLKWQVENAQNGFPHLYKHADHAAPRDIPRKAQDKQLIAGMNFFAAAERFAQLSNLIGKEKDAQWASELARDTRESVLTRYDTENHTFGNGTQDSLALGLGLFANDPEEQKRIAASLIQVYRENGYKFDGGFMSYWIYPMLSRYGYVDEALKMLCNTDYPGPAWSIEQHDATTFWEIYLRDMGTHPSSSLSHHATNHPAGWLLTDLAGLRIDMEQPGGRNILLAPCIPKNLDHTKGRMELVTGQTAHSSWYKKNNKVKWSVTIPEGIKTRVHVPGWKQSNGLALPTHLKPGKHRFTLIKSESI